MELTKVKTFEGAGSGLAGFSFMHNGKEIRVGHLSSSFFSEVDFVKNIHTVRIREDGDYIYEIMFVGK